LLPDLPLLLADFLKQRTEDASHDKQILMDLLAAQKRTNKLLQAIIYSGVGFVLGLIVMQIIYRIRL